MNQAILFPDLYHWDEKLQSVVFHAQQGGALIDCIVGTAELAKLSGAVVSDGQQALSVFEQYRFDLEELAESLIEDEEFNARGNIEIVSLEQQRL